MNEETYKTSDLYLATYLVMRGKDLLRISRVNLKKSAFVFMGDCDDEVDDFFNGEGKKFLEYAQTMRDLKSQMYATMEIKMDSEADPENLRKGYKL